MQVWSNMMWCRTELTQYIIRIMCVVFTANTRRSPNVSLMLARHRRRRPNIKEKLGQRLVFDGVITSCSVIFSLGAFFLFLTCLTDLASGPVLIRIDNLSDGSKHWVNVGLTSLKLEKHINAVQISPFVWRTFLAGSANVYLYSKQVLNFDLYGTVGGGGGGGGAPKLFIT